MISVDTDPTTNPTLRTSVVQLSNDLKSGRTPEALKNLNIQMIWASPPCTPFSAANTSRTDDEKSAQLKHGEELVKACMDIIETIKPKAWAIENPDSGPNRLALREITKGIRSTARTASYCHYQRDDRKATVIFTNVESFTPKDCRTEQCLTKSLLGRHTRTAQAGPTILRDGTKIPGTPKLDSQKVPEALIQLWVNRAIAEFGIGTAKLTAYAVNTLSDESELGKQVRSLGEVPKAELIEAQEREIDGLFKKKNAFEIVPFKERDRSAPILQHVWVHKVRSDDTVKSRLCIGGHRQKHGHSYWETSSPTPRPTSIRIALGIAAQNGWEPRTSDVAQAYVAANLGVLMYMRPPEEFKGYLKKNGVKAPDDFLLKVRKGLYGAKQSGRLWHNECTKTLTESIGYTQCQKDPCLFFKKKADGSLSELVLLYVDDFLFLGPRERHDVFLSAMQKKYDISSSEPNRLTIWNGLEIIRNQDGTISVTQVAKAREMEREYAALLAEFKLNGKAKVLHPELVGEDLFHPSLAIDLDTATAAELETIKHYQSVVGSMMYLATCTRFDIAYSLGKASRLSHRASRENLRGALRLLRYVIDHSQIGLTFRKNVCTPRGEPRIFTFVDSNYGNEPLNCHDQSNLGRKSTSAIIIMAFGTAIYWKSKLQDIVATSSGEAEFRAAALALKETAFITHLMKELGFKGYERAQVPVFSDSMTCIAHLKRDGVAWLEGTRQHEVELSAATQRCRNGEVVPIKISGKDNPADLLSKSDMQNIASRMQHIRRISGAKSKITFQQWIRDIIVTNFRGTDIDETYGMLTPGDLLAKNGLTAITA